MRERVARFFSSFPRIVLGISLGVAACDGENKSRRATSIAAPKVTTYDVRGVLRGVRADGRKAVIAHEAIPGYMEAMAMEFDVQDSTLPSDLESGDRIAFRLTVTDRQSWIDQVRKIGEPTGPRPPERGPTFPDGASLESGALLPDCSLIDQQGRAFQLGDFKGRVLALTFIFTRCPLPNFCPLMNQHLASAQRELKAASTPVNWHLLSISLDPEYDTPERLATYASAYSPDSERWTFATGRVDDIRKFGATFGLTAIRNGEQIDHNLRTVVVDTAGRVKKVFAGNEWTPRELIDEMKRAMVPRP